MIIFLLVLLFPAFLHAADDFKNVDGKIVFPVSSVDGKTFYTTKEQNDYTAKVPTATVVPYTPTKFEVSIATNIPRFADREEFLKMSTKNGLFEMLVKLKPEYDVSVLLGRQEFVLRYKYLLELYEKMPE